MPERLPAADQSIELCFSNLNAPEWIVATAGVQTYQRLIQKIEGDTSQPIYNGGYEITPTHQLALDARRHKLATAHNAMQGAPFASRLHQTWPQGLLTAARTSSPRSAVINAVARGMMPETRASLKTIDRMSRQLGGVPLIVYGDQLDEQGQLVDFSDTGFMTATQISPEVLTMLGEGQPFRDVHDSLWSRGVQGLIVDCHHIQRTFAGSDRTPDWQAILGEIRSVGTLVLGVHVSAGRRDAKHETERARSQQELAALVKGPEAFGRTAMGEILAATYEVWRDQQQTTLLPQRRLEELTIARRTDATAASNKNAVDRLRTYAADPVESQFRAESAYKYVSAGRRSRLGVTTEVPYRGLVRLREASARISDRDFTALHRDIGLHVRAFYDSLAKA